VFLDEGGGKKLNIDPPNAAALQGTMTHKLDYFGVRDGSRLWHFLIRIQKSSATAPIADEQLTVDQCVSADFFVF
jgi:hypothetical protein